ncbi:heme biosynthesis HemY N-terminal domain-containing protein [Reinekea sp.]|jgi:HemY protein|uniref:heme biosynthesis HemY N-terminal domain-containing protein n=1 Tax=Reinekea sp. TaxID=1970455 RepID=UPI0039899530
MMRLLGWALLWIIVLLLGGVLAKMMLADAGVMMVTWNGWLVETTFWAGIGFLLLFTITILIFIQLWRGFAPTRLWQRFRQRKNQKTAKKDTVQAVNAWLAGQDDKAIVALKRVADAGGSDRLPRAMTLALGWQHADWLERQAELIQIDPELKLFAYAIGAQRLWAENQTKQFIAQMNQHSELKKVPWLRRHLWQSLLEQGEGEALLDLAIIAANIQPDERHSWVVKGAKLAMEKLTGKADEGRQLLKKVPKATRLQPEFLLVEIDFWVSINDHDTAYKKLLAGFKNGHFEALLPALSVIQTDASKKLALLEQYEQSEPSANYCRALGQVNLALQLWGQAQSWLEKGWALNDRESGLMLAQLFEQRKMPEQANKLYKQLATA